MITIKKFKDQEQTKLFLKDKIGVYDEGINIMTPKSDIINIYIPNIKNQAAAIIKQEILSIGSDAAVSADVIKFEKGTGNILLMATMPQISKLLKKLELQPYGLKDIAEQIQQSVFNYFTNHGKTKIMGILNVTPDSFSDGGRFNSIDAAVKQAEKLIAEGADIIDIGAESSRPGAEPISEEEELNRLLPILKAIKKQFEFDVVISVDTYKANIAKASLDVGVDIINDISAFASDDKMAKVVAESGCGVVLMDNKNADVDDIIDHLKERIDFAGSCGIEKENIIIDPGIGFAKTVENNLEILKRIKEFKVLGVPILVGASRKSVIGHVLDKEVEERLFGSLAVAAIMYDRGVDILRVHDVAETRDVCKMVRHII